jgi:hypothetical protein
MCILSKQELAGLLKVPTTVEGAKMIKERNEALLEAIGNIPLTKKCMNAELDSNSNYSFEFQVSIGCSHCSGTAMDCPTCAYAWYPKELFRRKVTDIDPVHTAPCLDVPYDGTTANDLSHPDRELYLSYDSNDAEIAVLVAGPVDGADMVEVRRQYRELEHMFRGHIEWAEAVIELGGVPEPEESDETV